MSSKSKSCSLDPIPTNILKDLADGKLATIHPCDVQQIPPRGSPSIFPEVCDPFTDCREVLLDPNDVRSYRLISNLTFVSKLSERMVYQQLDIAYLEKHDRTTSFRNINPASTLIIRRKQPISRSSLTSSVLLTRAVWPCSVFSTCQPLAWLRSFLTGRSQQVSFNGGLSSIDRLDHYRRTARQCPWTVTVPALLSGCTTNRQPAWTLYPLQCWWWTDLRFRKGRSSQ